MSTARPRKGDKSEKAMTTAAAQEMLDRNAEIIRDIISLQEQAMKPGGLRQAADLAERKEKLQAQLHRRLLKLARWSDTPYPERVRADQEYELREQKALDSVLTNGGSRGPARGRGARMPSRPKSQPSLRFADVFMDKTGRWVAQVSAQGKQHFVGVYNTEDDAGRAAAQAAAAVQRGDGLVSLTDGSVSHQVNLLQQDSLRQINVANAQAAGQPVLDKQQVLQSAAQRLGVRLDQQPQPQPQMQQPKPYPAQHMVAGFPGAPYPGFPNPAQQPPMQAPSQQQRLAQQQHAAQLQYAAQQRAMQQRAMQQQHAAMQQQQQQAAAAQHYAAAQQQQQAAATSEQPAAAASAAASAAAVAAAPGSAGTAATSASFPPLQMNQGVPPVAAAAAASPAVAPIIQAAPSEVPTSDSTQAPDTTALAPAATATPAPVTGPAAATEAGNSVATTGIPAAEALPSTAPEAAAVAQNAAAQAAAAPEENKAKEFKPLEERDVL